MYMYKYSAYTYDIYRYIENLNGNCNDIVFQFLIILFTDDGVAKPSGSARKRRSALFTFGVVFMIND